MMHATTEHSMQSTTRTVIHGQALGLASQPVYATLVQFPAVCFFGAFLTDLAYWRTVNYIWETFSIWLLAAGCVFAGLAGIAAIVTWIAHRHVRRVRFAGLYVLACLAAAILSVLNAFIHSRDGYAAVVPGGITLSATVVILMCVATWLGWPRVQYVQETRSTGAL